MPFGRKIEVKKSKYEIDMCNGSIMDKLISFSLPLMLSGILQLMFNAVDIIVVGRFSGSEALAAVGSTTALISMFTNLFIGVSLGTSVLTARFYAAGRDQEVSETVHTSIMLALLSGILMVFVGLFFSRGALELMDTPDDVIDLSTLYMKIYFVGMPFFMLYNYGAAVLRAVGDTKRPLFYLVTAGIINVCFNLFFVIVCHLGVAGVGLATVIAEYISAALIIRCLMRSQGCCHLDLHQLGIVKGKLRQIMQIGLPAGMQGVVFSLSNVLIQSSINSFGSTAMAGNTASMNIENFIYISMNTFQQTAMSFTSQNYGAGEEKRIHKVLFICQGLVISVGLIFGVGAWLAGDTLLSIYSSDPNVIQFGKDRMAVICTAYFLCGIMDTMVGALRGVGYSLMPMIVSLIGACGLRIVWIFTAFQIHRSLWMLYISYPITWIITGGVHILCYILVRRKQLQTVKNL